MAIKTKAYNPSNLDAWWKSMQDADRREWIRVSAETGEYLQALTGRDDLLAVVEPGVGMGNLAVYIPEKAHVEVNTDRCAEGIAPQDVNMSTEAGRLRNPALTGACTHEGSHALASKWALDQRPEMRKIVQSALLLEESRCEKAMLAANPDERTFLRAGFRDLVTGGDTSAPTTVGGAARLAALSMARVDAGVLDPAEMTAVRDEIVAVTGEDLYESLRAVWLEAHTKADDDQAGMEALGKKWNDLLPEEEGDGEEGGITVIICGMPAPGEGDGEGGEEGEGSGSGTGTGESKDGEGEGEGEGFGEGGESALDKAAKAISAAAEEEAADEVEAAKTRDAAAGIKKDNAEQKRAEKSAERVFKISHGHGAGGYEGVSGSTAPTAQVRGTANVLAKAIQKAQFRARSKTHVASTVPPGHLRGSAAVRRSAQRAQGIPVTAQPWRQIQRKHVENPPITCGIMLDVSGSMRWAEQPVAAAAWAIAHAIHRNEGDSATVAYGGSVHPVVRPGENPKSMAVLDAGGGTEVPVEAIRALDGALNLSNGIGARLLVNISDGQYTPSQIEGMDRILPRLVSKGVKVLWIDMDGGGWGGTRVPRIKGVEAVKVKPGDDLGVVIGAAMTKALKDA